jgi:hypothetical protein
MLSHAGEQKIETPAKTVGEALNEAGVARPAIGSQPPASFAAGTIITVGNPCH